MKTDIYNRIASHPNYRDFVLPLEKLDFIRDAMLFIRKDGLVAFSEGYFHPPGKLIANIIYAPDPAGKKTIFGQPYRSVIKKKGTGDEEAWINYESQLEIYRELAPESQKGKPVFAEFKCQFDLKDFVGFVDHRRSLQKARDLKPEIDDAMKKTARRLSIPVESIGCTGSLSLGNLATAHDFDLVFYGTVKEHWRIVEQIYEIVQDPKRQVFELGMLWAIRFYDDWGNMICPFFSYSDRSEIALPEFEMKLIDPAAELTGTVADDRHTFYMPSVLQMKDAGVSARPDLKAVTLILYHGGLRGEYKKGDRVRARGKVVEVKTPRKVFPAFLCTNLAESKKL